MRKAILLGTLIILSGCSPQDQPSSPRRRPLEANLAAGQALYTTCAGCHGDEGQGRPELGAPRLAGQSSAYLSHQLAMFRAGMRGSKRDPGAYQMRARANALPNGDPSIGQVIGWIGTFTTPRPTDLDRASNAAGMPGAQAYGNLCAACHGTHGSGNKALSAPALRGLDALYIVKQVKDYRTGIRGYDPRDANGAVMVGAAQAVDSDATIDQIAAYLAQL